MKKSHIRDYTTECFRFFAKHRKTPMEEIALFDNNAKNDYLAVWETLLELERGGKDDIISAIEAVYFVAPSSPIRKGDITARITRHALEAYTSDRVVYRQLYTARLICAQKRGLRA